MVQSEQPSHDTTDAASGATGAACCSGDLTVSFDAIETDVQLLSALANQTRYGALRLLANADREICACNLAPPLEVSQSAISHALATLYEAGLVHRRKEGRWRYYWTTPLAEAVLAVFDQHEETDHE